MRGSDGRRGHPGPLLVPEEGAGQEPVHAAAGLLAPCLSRRRPSRLPDALRPRGARALADGQHILPGGWRLGLGSCWPSSFVLVSVPKASQGRPPSEVALPLAFQPRVHTCTAPRPVSCSVRRWKYGKSYDDAESCCITQKCYFFLPIQAALVSGIIPVHLGKADLASAYMVTRYSVHRCPIFSISFYT